MIEGKMISAELVVLTWLDPVVPPAVITDRVDDPDVKLEEMPVVTRPPPVTTLEVVKLENPPLVAIGANVEVLETMVTEQFDPEGDVH